MKVTIEIKTQDAQRAAYIGGLVQNALNVVSEPDIVKLLEKVRQKPGLVKTALKFVYYGKEGVSYSVEQCR